MQQVVARHYGLTQIVIVVAAVDAYELLRWLLHPSRALALAHAHEVASLERVAHFAWEAPLQRAFLRAPDLVRAMNLFYLVAHFAVTGLFFCWLYRRSPVGFRRFRNAFLAATAVALAGHAAFPAAPPRLADVGLEDTMRRLSGIGIGSVSNPLAAIPSLHAGWALGVGIGLAAYARSTAARVAAAAYPAAVALTILVTGNHFVLDAVAGMAIMTLALIVVQCAERRGVEQPGSSPGS
jgi:hypothetical protein